MSKGKNLEGTFVDTPRLPVFQTSKKAAFTLAEVLITLGIIGVVAAITIPALISNINTREYYRARTKVLSSVGEAGRVLAVQGSISSASSAETFVRDYLSKRLRIIKMCDSTKLIECGLPASFKKLDGINTMDMPTKFSDLGVPTLDAASSWYDIKDNPSFGFVMSNGYAINLFYNPNCIADTKDDNPGATGYACINAIYDFNGLKRPNQVGKDIGFFTVVYPNESTRAVAPNPATTTISGTYDWDTAQAKCLELGKEYTLPDKDELLSMAINGNLIGIIDGRYWSGSIMENFPTRAWRQNFHNGNRPWGTKTVSNYGVHCVKR